MGGSPCIGVEYNLSLNLLALILADYGPHSSTVYVRSRKHTHVQTVIHFTSPHTPLWATTSPQLLVHTAPQRFQEPLSWSCRRLRHANINATLCMHGCTCWYLHLTLDWPRFTCSWAAETRQRVSYIKMCIYTIRSASMLTAKTWRFT